MTAKARSVEWGRKCGYLVGDVEQAKWLPLGEECDKCEQPKMRFWRKDLFGWGDLLFISLDGKEDILVQASKHAGVAMRMTASEEFERYLRSGRRAELHVWSPPSPGGGRRKWLLRRYRIVLGDMGLEARRMLDIDDPEKKAGQANQDEVL